MEAEVETEAETWTESESGHSGKSLFRLSVSFLNLLIAIENYAEINI